jgi:type I restriction enzyme S subunit
LSFPTAAVKRYAHVIGGSTPTPDAVYWDGEVNWLTPTDVSEGHGGEITTSARTISARGLVACSATLVPAESVVVTTRAPIGNVAVTRLPSATNQGCRTLLLDPQLDPYYLRYQLQVRTEELRSYGAGSTFPELSGTALGRTRVQVPNLDQQRTIVSSLDRECERLADLSGMILDVEQVAVAVAKSSFDARTAAWPRIPVRHLLTAIDQGWSPQCEEREPEPGEWGVLKLGCVNEGEFAYQAKALGSEKEPRPEHTVGEGDVLMSRANTRELVGSCALVTSAIPPKTMLSDLLYRLTPDERRCTPEFLVVSLGARSARQQIEARATGSAGSMPKLSQAAIKQLTIPHGSLDEQNAVLDSLASELMPLTQLSRERGRLRTGLAEYRDALITEAVTGKLDVARLSEQQMDESAHAAMEGERPEVLSA